MQEVDRLKLKIESLEKRLLTMSVVSRRVTETLDLHTVLQEVVDGARSLTEARYGALAAFDDSGHVGELFISGITAGERKMMGPMPKGRGLIGFLNEIRAPLRLADLSKHPRSVGLPEFLPPMKTFLGTPIRHLGEAVGNIYLTEKEGAREFTKVDEDTLVMFASQAAMAIANALRYGEEQQARSDAEDERARLETLVNASPVGVLIVDARSQLVVSVNQEAQRIMGVPPASGASIEHYRELAVCRRMDGKVYENGERPLARALDQGEVVRAEEILFDLPDGRQITTLVNATPIYSEDGEIVSAVAVIQDMTPLEEIQRLRNDFLAMVSRELRSPLTVIKGSSATMLGASTRFDLLEARHYFRIIDQQADLMNKLITNLLDLTSMEAGQLLITPRRTDTIDLVESAMSKFHRSGPGNRIEVDLQADLPAISADPQRVTQVLNILLSNASKYSPASSTIKIDASTIEPYVAVSVTDAGQRAADDQLPLPFRKFQWPYGRDSGEKIAGENLGLVICKGIVEAHGGRIWAESDSDGRSTRFTFTIPVAADTAEDSDRASVDTGQMAGMRDNTQILYVDDDPQMLRYVRKILSDAGHIPIVTGNPNEMVHLLEKEHPDLVLLDLILPGTDGFELMKGIREISRVPVIFLSVSSQEENIVRALDLGATDYIVKPFSPTELVARIGSALRNGSGTTDAEERKPFQLGDVTIDYGARSVTVSGRPAQLTATEYRLLFELSVNAGRVLTHEQLLQRVWGTGYSVGGNLVRVSVGNLRSKLGDDARKPKYIFTEPRVGYRMAKP